MYTMVSFSLSQIRRATHPIPLLIGAPLHQKQLPPNTQASIESSMHENILLPQYVYKLISYGVV